MNLLDLIKAKIIKLYTSCVYGIALLPFRAAKQGASYIFRGFTTISAYVGKFGYNILYYYYQNALKESKKLFIIFPINNLDVIYT